MTKRAGFADGPAVDLLMSLTAQDVPGMNQEAMRAAANYTQDACSTFTPSLHKNARVKGDGALVRCVRCGKPQHQHWLRQALDTITP